MDKRYQVFISSTFADLTEERSKVQQAIMELDCIPAGMEVFPAIDEEQFEFIKKVIDDCDYYLLIIGGRYGSLSDAGVSYTELEYDYAVSKGIKVMAFLHEKPEEISAGKSEQDATSRGKLLAFREKVSTNRLIKFWKTANELPGLVALSLAKTIKTYPAIGWIRASAAQDPEVYKELSDLRKQNQELKDAARQTATLGQSQGLAGLDDTVVIKGTAKTMAAGIAESFSWEISLTWGSLFGLIAPYLLSPQEDGSVADKLTSLLYTRSNNKKEGYVIGKKITTSVFQTVKIHFKALGLIALKPAAAKLYWSLTTVGEQELISLRAVKRKPE
ncbi:DUF4062 domain-containing protein [Hymenobacter sp. HMF4947]|uniref:DUF4062 domain-containing protein n=2 Tax=Hymenobacter ginkgonis TaxID=2682976 RepID=A0A7K1TLH7_9BACT|nr:DUF4062 domain-containing protein [Hymenobacter ginkgonis]